MWAYKVQAYPRVRATGRDQKKPFKTRDFELPFFEGSLPSCSHSAPRNTEISHRPCVRCAAIRIARLAFVRLTLVAQCSATPATVAATPPCSATPLISDPNFGATPPGTGGGGRCDTKIFKGCSATPVLHLQNALKSRKSAATRVARHV